MLMASLASAEVSAGAVAKADQYKIIYLITPVFHEYIFNYIVANVNCSKVYQFSTNKSAMSKDIKGRVSTE
jgi:hypothetical protein